jgi:hypothetical protein
MKKLSKTAITLVVVGVVAACGGGPTPTRSGAPASALTTAEGLCGLLGASDWQQFNYVTAAQPDVSSDGEGTAICSWADGLDLEVYTHTDASEAEATYDTVIENVPMDDPQPFLVQGAAQSAFDSDLGDGRAGMVAQAGRLVVFVSGVSRDTAQAELAALAGLVIARGSTLI